MWLSSHCALVLVLVLDSTGAEPCRTREISGEAPEGSIGAVAGNESFMVEIWLEKKFACAGLVTEECWLIAVTECAVPLFSYHEDKDVQLSTPPVRQNGLILREKIDVKITSLTVTSKHGPNASSPISLLRLDDCFGFNISVHKMHIWYDTIKDNYTEKVDFYGYTNPTMYDGVTHVTVSGVVKYDDWCVGMTSYDLCVLSSRVPKICELANGAVLIRRDRILGILYASFNACREDGYALVVRAEYIHTFISETMFLFRSMEGTGNVQLVTIGSELDKFWYKTKNFFKKSGYPVQNIQYKYVRSLKKYIDNIEDGMAGADD